MNIGRVYSERRIGEGGDKEDSGKSTSEWDKKP